MWNLSTPLDELLIRSSVIFIVLFIMFRFFGKKHLGEMAPFDFLLLLIISEAVQSSLMGDDKSIQGGLIVVAVLMFWAATMNIVSYYSQKAEKFLEGESRPLIKNGELEEQILKKEKITLAELHEALREQGVMKVQDVGLAMLETNGKISVIKKEDISTGLPL